MEISRKLSGATLTAKLNLKGIKEEVYLGRIYGVAESIEKVDTSFGVEADKFNGEFVCVRADGDMATAPTCYLPPVVSDMTANSVAKNGSVKFGFDFFAVPSEKSKTGYIWKAQPLMEVKQSESLLQFAQDFPALPNGKQEIKPEAPLTHAKAKAKAE